MFGPTENLATLRQMKAGLEREGLSAHLMAQPLGYHTPDVGRYGWITLDEFPYGESGAWGPSLPPAMEPRLVTRWEVARWAREAYTLGVRVLGGCCGFEPYHIRSPESAPPQDLVFTSIAFRAIAEELSEERGRLPEGSDKSDRDLRTLKMKADMGRPDFAGKGEKKFWWEMEPTTGRPRSAPLGRPRKVPE